MDVQVNPKTPEHISSGPVLQQTSWWAKVKARQGNSPRAFDIKIQKDIKKNTGFRIQEDDLLIILRRLGGHALMAYVPYGPGIDPGEEDQGRFLEELAETIRPHLPDNCLLIRFDLRWQSPWFYDENRYNEDGSWMGPPQSNIQEMRLNFNTMEGKLRKAPTDVLPSHTMFIDLQKDKGSLLASMKPKTRYNIRLSARKGVEVHDVDKYNLDIWYKLYQHTAKRNHIHHNNIEYFKSILETSAEKTDSPAFPHLLLAVAEGKPLAGMIMVVNGKRATYLYGASSSANRNLMGTYALQWNAIKKAKALGCNEYDLFGVSPTPDPSHPMYGLYRFKSGFGGDFFSRQGCWDYPYDEKKYEIYRSIELNSTGYHLK
ncbi:MAG TPA: peptidoglycan bridge formation glycyltransferase FemA/FemB family protein [Bacteroidales bacterium]|nr:peptidoglycan bridge formation glycyltransferase FemA/FemB family protein [Bacteroidales bacterium]